MARSRARRSLNRKKSPGEVVAGRREPGVESAIRWTLRADRDGRSRLPAKHRRSRRDVAGTDRVLECRQRQAAVGTSFQYLSQRRAAASRRLGVAGWRSNDGKRLRVRRWRQPDRLKPRWKGFVGTLAR